MAAAAMSDRRVHDVVVVGAGAAGVGVGVALQYAGIDNFVLLERLMIGGSFALWPGETRFITPSFPTNSIGMLDLNSIALGTSPAFNLEVEHPSGEEYAIYLNAVARFYKLPVCEGTDVRTIVKNGDTYRIEAANAVLHAKHVIWAAGEFQYPRRSAFEGCELCQHTATIATYDDLEGDDFVVVGGYESGVDAAYHLARRGKRVRLLDRGTPWRVRSSDPSTALSTYSLERMREECFGAQVELLPDTAVTDVARVAGGYVVQAQDGRRFQTPVPPLWAGGFEGGHKLVADLFEVRDDGLPMLTEHDESTVAPGLFLCGPAVRHENHVFCFIFKYRQRFAVVAKAIATSLNLPAEGLEVYRKWGMFLDDLSCCGEECAC